ncbi:hypothetical protein [Tepidimonas sp.]|uniref:hypothetical protein n=1 Tax=Tepidimonas sp. TaxID=2002775 RepID=UPI002FDF261C
MDRNRIWALALALLVGGGVAQAKLPTPQLTEEQKAAAELAKAKAAHQGRVEAYQTCRAAERAAAHYFKAHPQAKPSPNAPACNDPGPFVPPGAAAAPVPGPAAKKS